MFNVRTLVCALLFVGCVHQPVVNTEADAVPDIPVVLDAGPELDIPLRESDAGIEALESTVLVVERPLPTHTIEDITLARRILKLKRKGLDRGIWFECGHKYTDTEMNTAALEWAVAINASSNKTKEYQLRNGTYVRVDLREAFAIMQSESKLDRCAVGPHPRIFAYKHGILKRKKNTLSHSLDEIQKAVQDPRFKRRKADLGPGQIVEYLGEMSWDDIKDYLSLSPGICKVFDEMAYRGKFYSTKTPSIYWPGSKKHHWYYRKIMRGIIPAFPSVRFLRYK